MLRVFTAVREFSTREGQPFHARFLLQAGARHAFASPSKSVRHLYAKDILEFLKTGDSADRLYSCKALLELSGKGLGRFQDAVVYNLMLVATNRVVVNYPVHPEVREEAIEALACILPSGAARKYPYLYSLRRLQTSGDEFGVKVAALISQLDDANVKFIDEPANDRDDDGVETAAPTVVMWELLLQQLDQLQGLSSWLASTCFSDTSVDGRENNALQ